MPKVPTISVIIPTYNDASFLERLLGSLCKQHFETFEVIVSDAESKDNIREVVEDFNKKLDITLFQSPPAGPGVGRNKGAAIARGEWFLFLDADDDVDDPEFMKTLLSETEKHGWQTSTAKIKHTDASRLEQFGSTMNYKYIKLLAHTKHPVAPGWCILTTKKAFETANGFNPDIRFGEDYDYVIRVADKGFGFVESTYYYVDLRRSREEGIKFALKGIANEIYRHTHRYKIKKNRIRYDFGTHKERVK